MDEIQAVLIKQGRNDLAQKYYQKKIMIQSVAGYTFGDWMKDNNINPK